MTTMKIALQVASWLDFIINSLVFVTVNESTQARLEICVENPLNFALDLYPVTIFWFLKEGKSKTPLSSCLNNS